MTNQHIAREEWLLFYKNRDAKISIRVLSHVAACRQCREVYDKAADLASAASACAVASTANQYSGYAAVASRSPMDMKPDAGSTLTVDIDMDGGRAIFLADSIEASGSARMYALNPSEDGTCLQEDADAFTLTAKGSTLTLRVEEALMGSVSAVLRSIGTEELPLVFEGCEASAVLPCDDMYVLEITFA